MTSKYLILKEQTRQEAQALQVYQEAISWGELAFMYNQLEKHAKRYGLVKELKREGII